MTPLGYALMMVRNVEVIRLAVPFLTPSRTADASGKLKLLGISSPPRMVAVEP